LRDRADLDLSPGADPSRLRQAARTLDASVRSLRLVRVKSSRHAPVFGPDHPLAIAVDAVERVRKQSLVVVGIWVGSMVALSEGRAWAPALALSSAIALLGFTIVVAAFRQRRRDRALDLIVEGRGALPIAALQCELRRLGAPRTQQRMACA
jgi:hypothetical protein